MSAIIMGDQVEIVRVSDDQKDLLHRRGRVVMITDDVNWVLRLDAGGSAVVTADQLKKVS
jgi:hypothetical protein